MGPDEPNLENKINQCNNYDIHEKVFIFGGDRPFNMITNNSFKTNLLNYREKGVCFVTIIV